jgi:hypothetical protein
MGHDAPERKGAQPPPDVFDSSYNELPSHQDSNPLFTEYQNTKGAPNGAPDVVIPQNQGDRPTVVVDGRVVSGDGGDVVINHADVVNIFYNGRQVPPQVARFEAASGSVFDQQYVQLGGDPSARMYGNRPLYGEAAREAFYHHRHGGGNRHRPGGGQVYVESDGGPMPQVMQRDSTIYGGPGGVVFNDSQTVVNGQVMQNPNRVSARDIFATGIAVLNSPVLEAIVNRGDHHHHHGGRNFRRPMPMVNFPIGEIGYGTPPFVPGGNRGRVVVMNDGGPPPMVYDTSSTVAGGPGGVIFQDSTTVVNGGVPQERPVGFRDIAAVGVALLNTPIIADAIGGHHHNGGDRYRGGRGNYYNQSRYAQESRQRIQNAHIRINARIT